MRALPDGYDPCVTHRFHVHSTWLLRIVSEGDYAIALEQLSDALPIRIAAVDRAGRVIVWNRAMEATGVQKPRALGRPLLDALPALARDANLDWAGDLERVLSERVTISRARHPMGDRVVGVTLAPLEGPGASHELLGAVLAIEDITERVRAEEKRLLRVRSDAVEDFGAGLAHEVRNPLNALSLNLQLLRERLEDPTADRADLVAKVDTMIGEMRRMDGLVTHLLEVSRGGPPAREPRRLDPIVARTVELLRGRADLAGASLVHVPGSSRTLELDAVRIERAIHNLVRNALEAVPRGGHVVVTTRDDPHSTVVVVDDDGPGIPPADRPRLFQLFFTRKRGGTGLGLPLAQRAIHDHGGEVEVLDRPGGGTRFVVHLPVDASGDGVASERTGADAASGDEPGRSGSR